MPLAKARKLATEKNIAGDAFRFLIAGGFNVLLTLCVYQFCLLAWNHNISYSISWAVGLVYLVVVYPSRVFPGGKTSPGKALIVVCSYLLVFSASLWSLNEIVGAGINERLAIFFVLAISTVLNFISMRIVYRII